MKYINTTGTGVLPIVELVRDSKLKVEDTPCAMLQFAKNNPEVKVLGLVCYCPRCTLTC